MTLEDVMRRHREQMKEINRQELLQIEKLGKLQSMMIFRGAMGQTMGSDRIDKIVEELIGHEPILGAPEQRPAG